LQVEFAVGSNVGPYEVVGLLGKGGMGEVYRARDSRLKRDVAMKILPAAISQDPDRVSRFQREAEVLASLNHPNIAAIHDLQRIDGSSFLILELVEGETLADRIARGPLQIEDALRIAKQIAEALETAHEKGVVHRDLKPANVKITPSGTVKVLDFGLAKVFEQESQSTNFSQSPTLMTGTLGGVVLGTAPYMSPEQARGQAVGDQTDIWAFGVVLYEVLTGKAAFSGETLTDVLGGIVRTDPDWAALPRETPLVIQLLLRQCLEKNRAARLHHIGDARIQIEAALNNAVISSLAASAPPAASRRPRLWIALAVLLPLAVAAATVPFVLEYYRLLSTDVGSVRFSVAAPPKSEFSQGGTAPYIAISPDGKQLAFIAVSGGTSSLWIRSLDSVEARPLVGTEGVSLASSPAPFWSPDSRFLAYFSQGKLKKIDVTGGPAQTICDGEGSSGTWNRDNVIIFDPGGAGGVLKRVQAAGGKAEPLTALNVTRQEQSHLYPHFLPDGDHFLFLSRTAVPENNAIMVGSLSSKDVKLVIKADSRPAYDRSGQLLYVREQSLMAHHFSLRNLQISGDPYPIAESVRYNSATGAASITVSGNGVLVYRAGNAVVGNNYKLTWMDRSGKLIGTLGNSGNYANPELSPDGKRVAVERLDPATRTSHIWVLDTVRGVSTRLTFTPGNDRFPVWSPDGEQIIFSSGQSQPGELYAKASTGAGTEQPLKTQAWAVWDWSEDAKAIVYSYMPRDISILPLSGNKSPVTYVPQSIFFRSSAQLSPDGKWLAYTSNESGNTEVYVQSFPTPSGKWMISTNGGAAPRWRHDGKEIFYIAADQKLMAVTVRPDDKNLAISSAGALFEAPLGSGVSLALGRGGASRQQYDVTSDGQRFLFNVLVDEAAETPITVVTNWTSSLKK